jgi:hypothetical protein
VLASEWRRRARGRRFAAERAVLPVDLRVRGLVSARFGHDGTELDAA